MRLNNFKNDYKGLNNEEVKESIKKYGINDLGQSRKDGFFKKLLKTFKEPMFILLIASSFIYLLLGEISDSLIMLVFVFVIIGISFYQEYKTDKALDALKELTSPKSKVIRNNKLEEIKSSEVVVGDIMVLYEGDVINAEGDILECHGFGVNESTLTGESLVVWKKIKLSSEEKSEYFKKNRCYAGTTVTGGFATVLVTNVGVNTEYGKIGSNLNKIVDVKTPLEKQMGKLIKVCASVSFIFLFLVTLVTFVKNSTNAPNLFERITHSIMSGITIAMATIPEELPVVLTVFLTMGAYIISKQKSLVRKMNAVETLGAVSVLCVDKTGTLTENKMVVVDNYAHINFEDLLKVSYLASEPEAYDPTEKAIINFYKKEKNTDKLKINIPVYEYPFTSETKIMGHVFKENKKYKSYIKGAYEKVLPLCDLTTEEMDLIKDKISELSKEGCRILAFAYGETDKLNKNLDTLKLNFVGLLAFADPPRYGIKEAVESCYEAGIKLVMITGDNGETAKIIAEKIGLINNGNVITGDELEKITDEELIELVRDTNIFARVHPNHKMRIVEAFQKNNMVVAMTGDGVNDATALKKAEIGIAMGQRGTEVAKQASKLILLDDNFKTIVTAVENGRRIYDNIQKAIKYILIIHIPIALIALLVPVFNLPILLLPIHVVILELIIDPTSSIIFERCKADKNIMKRKPRKINDSLVSRKYIFASIIQGLSIFIAFFGSYIYLLNNNYSKEIASTFALTVLILSNLFIVYINMSNTETAINCFIKSLKDKVITGINISILVMLSLIIYLPFVQKIVGTKTLNLYQTLTAIIISLVCTLWFDITKIIKNKKTK